nr:MAG TPA: hypothetical protein [Caudoviricetes sp.]
MTKTNTKAADTAEETNTIETDKAADTAEELVEVYVPIDHSNEDDDKIYVSVNGVAMFVPRGQRVKIPKPYAEVILNAEEERTKVTAKKRAERKD